MKTRKRPPLPGLMESGGLPALVSGLSGIHRVNLAAALYENLELPIFVVCPDDSAAESFTRDLEAMLGRPVNTLYSRDFTFYPSLAASREAEQKQPCCFKRPQMRRKPVTVATVSALMQRAIPPQTPRQGHFYGERRRAMPSRGAGVGASALRLHPLRAGRGHRPVCPAAAE